MTRMERAKIASVVVALSGVLFGGLDRIERGKSRQGGVMITGAAIGTAVLAARITAKRRQERAGPLPPGA